MALHIECRFNKNSLLHSYYLSFTIIVWWVVYHLPSNIVAHCQYGRVEDLTHLDDQLCLLTRVCTLDQRTIWNILSFWRICAAWFRCVNSCATTQKKKIKIGKNFHLNRDNLYWNRENRDSLSLQNISRIRFFIVVNYYVINYSLIVVCDCFRMVFLVKTRRPFISLN